MKVKDCMCSDVSCVKPDSTVSDVCKLMCNQHVGCIPVCDDSNKVVGLVTDRDVILRSIACDKDIKQTSVSEIMSCDVCCCGPEEEIENAEDLMSELQIRRIPVVDNDKIVGILTIGDLARNSKVNKEELCNTIENICDCEKGNHAE